MTLDLHGNDIHDTTIHALLFILPSHILVARVSPIRRIVRHFFREMDTPGTVAPRCGRKVIVVRGFHRSSRSSG